MPICSPAMSRTIRSSSAASNSISGRPRRRGADAPTNASSASPKASPIRACRPCSTSTAATCSLPARAPAASPRTCRGSGTTRCARRGARNWTLNINTADELLAGRGRQSSRVPRAALRFIEELAVERPEDRARSTTAPAAGSPITTPTSGARPRRSETSATAIRSGRTGRWAARGSASISGSTTRSRRPEVPPRTRLAGHERRRRVLPRLAGRGRQGPPRHRAVGVAGDRFTRPMAARRPSAWPPRWTCRSSGTSSPIASSRARPRHRRADFAARIEAARRNSIRCKIGARGQLQEWSRTSWRPNVHHRHLVAPVRRPSGPPDHARHPGAVRRGPHGARNPWRRRHRLVARLEDQFLGALPRWRPRLRAHQEPAPPRRRRRPSTAPAAASIRICSTPIRRSRSMAISPSPPGFPKCWSRAGSRSPVTGSQRPRSSCFRRCPRPGPTAR